MGRALAEALGFGINVVDTAPDYRDGRAEAAVGRALYEAFGAGVAARDGVFVSTRAGPTTPGVARTARKAGALKGDFARGGRYCVAPACLRASLDLSLERLRLASVDCLFVEDVAASRPDLDRAGVRDLYRTAFGWLENERRRGRLAAYGVAFAFETADARVLAEDLVPAARAAAGCGAAEGTPAGAVETCDHGLRYVAVPASLTSRALYGSDLDAAAAALGVAVFGTRSLRGDRPAAEKRGGNPCDPAGGDAVQVAASAPGLASALVGMKRGAHVEANLRALEAPPLTPAAFAAAVAAAAACYEGRGEGGENPPPRGESLHVSS